MMADRVVYFAEYGDDILLSFYLSDIISHFGLGGLYNFSGRHSDDFVYGGVHIRRFILRTKRGVYSPPSDNF